MSVPTPQRLAKKLKKLMNIDFKIFSKKSVLNSSIKKWTWNRQMNKKHRPIEKQQHKKVVAHPIVINRLDGWIHYIGLLEKQQYKQVHSIPCVIYTFHDSIFHKSSKNLFWDILGQVRGYPETKHIL